MKSDFRVRDPRLYFFFPADDIEYAGDRERIVSVKRKTCYDEIDEVEKSLDILRQKLDQPWPQNPPLLCRHDPDSRPWRVIDEFCQAFMFPDRLEWREESPALKIRAYEYLRNTDVLDQVERKVRHFRRKMDSRRYGILDATDHAGRTFTVKFPNPRFKGEKK